MQEFSSISVSSYEAGTLADRLTQQARDGWSVVAIVPTGSTVTAYLSRTADSDGAPSAPADAPAPEAAPVSADTGAPDTADAPETSDNASDDTSDDKSDDTSGESSDDTSDDDPVTAAPGWAAGASAVTTSDDSATESDSSTTSDIPAAASTDAPAAPTSEAAPAAAAAATSSTAATTGAAAAGAAPAGWYADPSSRFELRYWDGSQWTEHVSRAGQQYTDPPVA